MNPFKSNYVCIECGQYLRDPSYLCLCNWRKLKRELDSPLNSEIKQTAQEESSAKLDIDNK
jgi:hypothetical protein